jgi:hypothetical protein
VPLGICRYNGNILLFQEKLKRTANPNDHNTHCEYALMLWYALLLWSLGFAVNLLCSKIKFCCMPFSFFLTEGLYVAISQWLHIMFLHIQIWLCTWDASCSQYRTISHTGQCKRVYTLVSAGPHLLVQCKRVSHTGQCRTTLASAVQESIPHWLVQCKRVSHTGQCRTTLASAVQESIPHWLVQCKRVSHTGQCSAREYLTLVSAVQESIPHWSMHTC